ncbi:MAG: Hint domain-containing protein [Tabrizicola sp.]|uniref:Hint domain-containing protein n=1 Tax=Tabrizicola sp. TaxID=2005166 RepID=UPI002734ABD9|nr:Hint domain-containing protein [Tabrizicola sp.]MDP3264429.1 Hint domain-containing protein [Tabrizicola sp.]MDZ4069396.1 Hint domain-containing protein [Tabrizicola sp.]
MFSPANQNSTAASCGLMPLPQLAGDAARICPCFTPGTQIAAQHGEIAVERLLVGDRVVTRDNRLQEVRWIGKACMS